MSDAPRARWKRRLLTFAAGALLVGATATGVAFFVADAALEARVAQLERDLESVRERCARERAVIVDDAVEGNAAEWYGEVLRTYAATYDPRAGTPLDVQYAARQIREHVEKGGAITPAMEAVRRDCAELPGMVRQGLRRRTCDWRHPLEVGASAPYFDQHAVRIVALLMCWDAHEADDPDEALEVALEVVAFGRDLARHPTLFGAAVGETVGFLGYRALGDALARRPTRASLVRVLDALERLGPLDVGVNLDGERLWSLSEFAWTAGRPLGDPAVHALRKSRPGANVVSTIGVAYEWSRYEEFFGRQRATLAAPEAVRRPATQQVIDELDASWTLLTRIASANLAEPMLHADTLNATHHLVRALAAAHLRRLDRGAFPADIAALGEYLPTPALDPFREGGAALSCRVEGDRLVVWSWYANGVDDGGDGVPWGTNASPDLVVSTRLPD